MLMISNRRATSGLSSTFTFTTRSVSGCSLASSDRTGAMSLHGPHHSAQKSTNTNASAPLTSSSNVLSVSSVMPSAIAPVASW